MILFLSLFRSFSLPFSLIVLLSRERARGEGHVSVCLYDTRTFTHTYCIENSHTSFFSRFVLFWNTDTSFLSLLPSFPSSFFRSLVLFDGFVGVFVCLI